MSHTKRLLEQVQHSKRINKHNLGDDHWEFVTKQVQRLLDAEKKFNSLKLLDEELKVSKS